MKRLLSVISLLQIISLIAFLAIIIVLARLIHHQTENTFIQFWDYVASFKIAFPPFVILIVTYGFAFIAGKNLSEIPGAVIAFFRNRYFQSIKFMCLGLTGIAMLCVITLSYTESTAPPKYQALIEAILAGEVDRQNDAKKLIQGITKQNPELGQQLALVAETFELRRRTNLEANVTDVVQARLLVRALSNANAASWEKHPLRKHALAESYSLLSEGLLQNRNIDFGFGTLEPRNLYQRSIELYQSVADMDGHRLAISQLKASALNNIGNAHFYMGEYANALEAWENTLASHPNHKNVGTLGNMVAAYVVLGDYDKAISTGEDARAWAEENGKALQDTAHFVSILVNTGFAFVASKQIEKALPLFELSALIENDDNTKLNVALSHAMLHNSKKAEGHLRKISSPVTHNVLVSNATANSDKRCSQLLWALYSSDIDSRDIAARLYAFLGEKRSIAELNAYSNPAKLALLRKRVAEWLPKFPGSCATYSLMPSIVEFVKGPQNEP